MKEDNRAAHTNLPFKVSLRRNSHDQTTSQIKSPDTFTTNNKLRNTLCENIKAKETFPNSFLELVPNCIKITKISGKKLYVNILHD